MTDELRAEREEEDEGCQSNCDQPGPTGKCDGSVRDRVIGYYEAWTHNRKCQNMDFDRIPVGALSHAYFSFEIEPETNDNPDYGNTANPNGIPKPEFYVGILVHDNAKVHVIASV